MTEDQPGSYPRFPSFSVKSEMYLNGKLFTYDESYDVIGYADLSRYVEIHKPGCTVWRKESAIHMNEKPRYLSSTQVIGPLENAERAAEMDARELNYSGWKKAECCFDPNWKGTKPTKEEIIKLYRLNPPKTRLHTAFRYDKPRAGFKQLATALEEIMGGLRRWNPENPLYFVMLYPDHSRYVEVHKWDCMTLRKEMEEYKTGQDAGSWIAVNAPVEEADKSAELNAKDNNYPGWKRAGCCFK